MLTPEFNALFEDLVAAFIRYHDASRRTDELSELAQHRFALEQARAAIARERQAILAVQATHDDARWLAAVGISPI